MKLYSYISVLIFAIICFVPITLFIEDKIEHYKWNKFYFNYYKELTKEKEEDLNLDRYKIQTFADRLKETYGVYDEKDSCDYLYFNEYDLDNCVRFFIEEIKQGDIYKPTPQMLAECDCKGNCKDCGGKKSCYGLEEKIK